MAKKILLIQGHPDASETHLCQALATSYAQVARPGFAFTYEEGGNPWGKKALTGRSARVVVTMGMPALVYRWYFRAHSVKSLERNILGFVGEKQSEYAVDKYFALRRAGGR